MSAGVSGALFLRPVEEEESLYKVGDKVVYPHHGAGTVVKKETSARFSGRSAST